MNWPLGSQNIELRDPAPLNAAAYPYGSEPARPNVFAGHNDSHVILSFFGTHWRTVAGMALLGACLTLAAASLVQPRYTAKALLLLDEAAQRLVDDDGMLITGSNLESLVESQVAMVGSQMVVEAAMESMIEVLVQRDVRQQGQSVGDASPVDFYLVQPGALSTVRDWLRFTFTPYLQGSLDPQGSGHAQGSRRAQEAWQSSAATLDAVMRHTRIDRVGKTFVISVEATGEDPVLAALWVNTIVEAYLADQLKAKTQAAEQAAAVLDMQVRDLALELQHLHARIDQALGEALEERLSSAPPGALPEHAGAHAALVEPFLDLTRERLGVLDAWRAARNSVARDVERVSAQPAVVTQSDVFEREVVRLERAASRLRADVIDRLNRTTLQGWLSVEILRLQAELEGAEAIYRTAYQRLKLAELNTSTQVAGARVQSPARPAHEPSYPMKLPLGLLGALCGALVGVMLSIRRDIEAETVFHDASETMPPPVQTSVALPQVHVQGRGGAIHIHRLALDQRSGAFSEALRRLDLEVMRLAGQLMAPAPVPTTAQVLASTLADIAAPASADGHARANIIAFASPEAGCGTSTLALSYALQKAAAGNPTLLIDADFRGPQQMQLLSLPKAPYGAQFSDFLAGNPGHRDLGTICYRDSETGLDLIANSRAPLEASATLLSSASFAHLLSSAAQVYQTIVIDTPPLSEAVDARLVARRASVVALCVRARKTPISNVRHAAMSLAARGETPHMPPLIGLLNGV